MSIILLSVELWGRIDPACIIIDLEQLKDWGGGGGICKIVGRGRVQRGISPFEFCAD